MFYVFSKQKIYTYVISIITVVVLFFVAETLINKEQSIQASSNSERLLPIYNVETKENKVSLTMNCAW